MLTAVLRAVLARRGDQRAGGLDRGRDRRARAAGRRRRRLPARVRDRARHLPARAHRRRAGHRSARSSASAAASACRCRGVIVDNLDLQWLFWINLIALPAAFAAHRLIPPSPPVENARVDWLGAFAALRRARGHPARRLAGGRSGAGARRPTSAAIAGGLALVGVFVVVEGRVDAAADRPAGPAPACGRGDEPDRLHGRRRDVLELPDHAPVRAGAGEHGLRLRLHRHPGRPAADADRARAAARRAAPATRIAERVGFRALLSTRRGADHALVPDRHLRPRAAVGARRSAASCSARASRSRSRRWRT